MVEYRGLDFLGFPGYKVGNDGSIWSCRKRGRPKGGTYSQQTEKWKKLKPGLNSHGYLTVILYYNKKQHNKGVHRLVLEAFLGPCPPKKEACHNNGNSTDNKVENLRWDTHKNNCKDNIIHGTMSRGIRNGKAKLTEEQVIEARELFKTGNYSGKELGEKYRVTCSTMCRIINRQSWKHIR